MTLDGNLIAYTILAVVALLLIAQYARERSIRRASEKRISLADTPHAPLPHHDTPSRRLVR